MAKYTKNRWCFLAVSFFVMVFSVVTAQDRLFASSMVQEKFEILRQSSPDRHSIPEYLSSEERQQELQRQADANARWERTRDRAIAELAAMGDAVLPSINDEFRRPGYSSLRHNLYVVLAEIGTTDAKTILFKEAVDRSWAARNYIRCAQTDEIIQLLQQSPSSEIQVVALQALEGVMLDSHFLEKLTPFSKSPDYMVRINTTNLFRSDPPKELLDEIVAVILDSAVTADRIHDAESMFNPFHAPAIQTVKDTYIWQVITLLMQMEGIEEQLNRYKTEADDFVKHLVSVVHAYRGNANVKQTIYTILNNSEDTSLRLPSLDAFSYIGDKTDLPYLEDISQNDSYSVLVPEIFLQPGTTLYMSFQEKLRFCVAERYYPGRFYARKSIDIIQAKK